MAYLLWVVLLLLGMFFKKSKIITIIIVLYIWAIISFNTASPDYLNNQYMYENIQLSVYKVYEPGYVALMKICGSLGIDFVGFRCVVAAIFIIISLLAIVQLTDNINIALVILMIYPCLTFASGLRTAIAYGIGLFSFSMLLKDDRHGVLKFSIGILIASLFHYSFLANLIFTLSKKKINIAKLIRYMLLELVLLLLLSQGAITTLLKYFITSSKILNWSILGNYSHPSIFSASAIVLTVGFVLFYLQNTFGYNKSAILLQHEISERKSIRYAQYTGIDRILANSAMLAMLFLPFFVINFTFERLLECQITISLIVLTSSYEKIRCANRLIKVVFIAFVLNTLFFTIVHSNLYFPILSNNILFIR
ncbi:MAG: EpsG family protein [Eubacteriales bacterium]|nr:EpsG family protein [Eubacteriales bacterium]